MKKYEDECVQCGFPCSDTCKYKNVPHWYCDECGEEEQLYYFGHKEICLNCFEKYLEKVE